MKKILAILLAVCALIGVSALGGCSYTPTEAEKAEALEAFKVLYPKSAELNEYIFGAGLPTTEGLLGSDQVPSYKDVSEEAKYKTKSELEAAILEVYSQSYYEEAIKPLLFDGYEGEDDINPRYKETKGILQLDVTSESVFPIGEFDISTAEIVKLTAAFCQIKCAYKRGDFSGDFTLTMEKTAEGWRFDAPTV